jgi:hypothetical protein
MHRNTSINLAVWSVLALAVAGLGVIIQCQTLALCVSYRTTTGRISETFPDNHQGIGFSYKVDGHDYSGSSYAGQIGRSFSSIQLGDTVTVFYAEHYPAICTLETPKVLLVRAIGQIVAACAILPVIGIFIIQRNRLFPRLYDYCKTSAA